MPVAYFAAANDDVVAVASCTVCALWQQVVPQPPAASDVALVVNKTLPTVDSRAQTNEQTTDRRDSWGNNEVAKEQQQEEKKERGKGRGHRLQCGICGILQRC